MRIALVIPAFRMAFVLFALVYLSSCSSTPSHNCRLGEDAVITDALYFGTAKRQGIVSFEEWQRFLSSEVTPRFPQGITSWNATGQWRPVNGELQHESSYILQLVHSDDAQTEQAVREVIDRYRGEFEQEAVLRVRLPACVTLQ